MEYLQELYRAVFNQTLGLRVELLNDLLSRRGKKYKYSSVKVSVFSFQADFSSFYLLDFIAVFPFN